MFPNNSNVVSICVPTYNGEKYLRETLNSVIAQTYNDVEILIIDDRSTDDTMDILREYAAKEKRIRIVQNEKNLGLVNNWNRCIEMAHGDWIKFVFQDDIIAPDCVEKLLDSCKGGHRFAACRRSIMFENNAESVKKYYERYIDNVTIEKIFLGKTIIPPELFRSQCLKYLLANFIGEPTAVLLNKNIIKNYGFFNPNLIQMCDIEFWTRIGIHEGLVYVPDNLATFRVHSDGTSFVNRRKRSYRMHFLDSIIIYHEFAFNHHYKPLRDIAFDAVPQVNFRDLLIYHVHETVTTMDSRLRNGISEDLDLYAEWEDIKKEYPILSELPIRGIYRIIHAINRRLRGFYYNSYYNKVFTNKNHN